MAKVMKISVFFGILLTVLSLTPSAHAVNQSSSNKFYRSSDHMVSTPSASGKMIALNNTGATTAAMKKSKLSEARLKICNQRAANVSMRFKNLLSLGMKSHENLDETVTRVDDFYNSKLISAGYTLPNYTVLKSDITTKQANVNTLLDKAKVDGQSFSCDSDDPKTQADTFRQDVQSLILANKAYRISVRTFVVSVRDLALKAKMAKLSPSPAVSPIENPEATEAPIQ